jgi:hypothetical protein
MPPSSSRSKFFDGQPAVVILSFNTLPSVVGWHKLYGFLSDKHICRVATKHLAGLSSLLHAVN